jgi:hypothetical protein
MSRSQPTSLSELLEQRDDDLSAGVERARQDVHAASADLAAGNVVAAREMLVAIGIELEQMRGLLP